MAFRWRNGFIEEIPGEDVRLGQGGDSPRSVRSEPASINSEHQGSSFQGEKDYVDTLNSSIDSFRPQISVKNSESGMTGLTEFVRSEKGGSEPNDDADNDHGLVGLTARKMNTHMETDISTTNLRTEAVRQQVQQNLSKAKTNKTRTLTTALAAIEEISVQVSSALQCSGNTFAEDVQDTIGELRTRMRDEDGTVAIDAAIESLDIIPDMIVQSFEASAQVAKKTLQDKVDTVLRGIAEMQMEDDEVLSHMRSIPSEVEDITKRAVEDAVTNSQLQASLQVNFAMVSLPEWQNSLKDAKNRIDANVAGMETHAVQVATSQAMETIAKTVEAVKQNEEGNSSRATNEVVADTLLRAKATGNQIPSQGELPMLEKTLSRGSRVDKPLMEDPVSSINPGSVGHPELCTRPCLYFATGSCVNGTTCEFCHLPHPKRPAHLDKRNREMLKAMPQSECVALVLPILQAKVDELNLGTDMMNLVNKVGEAAQVGSMHSGKKAPNSSKERAALLTALKAMSLRSLLMMLNRSSTLAPTHPQNLAVDAVWQHLRMRSHLLTVEKMMEAPPDIVGLTPTPVDLTAGLAHTRRPTRGEGPLREPRAPMPKARTSSGYR